MTVVIDDSKTQYLLYVDDNIYSLYEKKEDAKNKMSELASIREKEFTDEVFRQDDDEKVTIFTKSSGVFFHGPLVLRFKAYIKPLPKMNFNLYAEKIAKFKADRENLENNQL